MSTNDLFNYMRDATHMMQSEYDRIQKRAAEDPGTAGDNGEENWADLLKLWLPSKYHIVTKGRIMNTDGECGPQVDVLVLSPSYPEALLNRKEYLAGGIIAAFECKLTLKSAHVRKAAESSAIIRRLLKPSPTKINTPYNELNALPRYGLLAHSHDWKGEGSRPIDNIERQLFESEKEITIHPNELIDLICVSDLASWHTNKLIMAGRQSLKHMDSRYASLGEYWNKLKEDGGLVESVHVAFTESLQQSDDSKKLFTPIGSFITRLLEMISWEDYNLRPIAEYFILTNLLGSGKGQCRIWDLNVFTEGVKREILNERHLFSLGRWNEWGRHF